MKVTWNPAARDWKHASTRIRAMQPRAWLTEHMPEWEFQEHSIGRNTQSDIAVHFKHIDRDIKATSHILDLSDNHVDVDGPVGDASRRDVGAADIVVVPTRPFADAIRHLARDVVVIPDTIDPLVSDPRNDKKFGGLLWFGNWGSKHHAEGGMRDLLLPELYDALDGWWGHLIICSNNMALWKEIRTDLPLPIRYVEWHPDTISDLLASAELVIVPVSDTPYLRCKSHNRVTTAIAAGVPVVASHHPAYEEFGVCVDDWEDALSNPPGPRPQHLLDPYHIDRIGAKWKLLLEWVGSLENDAALTSVDI